MGMESVLALWPSCRRIAASRGKWVFRISVSGSLSTRYVLTSTHHSTLSHSPSFHFTLSHSTFCCSILFSHFPFHILSFHTLFTFSISHSPIPHSFHIFHFTFSHSTLFSHFPFHILPFCILLFHFLHLLFHILPFHILPFHILPFHILPFSLPRPQTMAVMYSRNIGLTTTTVQVPPVPLPTPVKS